MNADLSMLRGLGEDGIGGEEGSKDEGGGVGGEDFEGFEAEATASEDDSGPAWPTDNGEIQRLQAELQVRVCAGWKGSLQTGSQALLGARIRELNSVSCPEPLNIPSPLILPSLPGRQDAQEPRGAGR